MIPAPSVIAGYACERGVTYLDNFIREVNADHTDVILVSRSNACYMRDEIERLRKAEPKGETQQSVSQWCRDVFPEYLGLDNRSIAVLEEAVELALGCGVTPETIRSVIEVPIRKEIERGWQPGSQPDRANLEEEVGDLQINLFAIAEEAGIRTQGALNAKMEKNRSRPLEYYRAKSQRKVEMGLRLQPGTEPSQATEAPGRGKS